MLSRVFSPAGGLVITVLVAAAVFAAYCHLHALAKGVFLPWTQPAWWGLIAGAPAGALVYVIWRCRARFSKVAGPLSSSVLVLLTILVWGIMTRSVIGPRKVPAGAELVTELFAILPLAAAAAVAAAMFLARSAGHQSKVAASPWIHLPEEPRLQLRAGELDWVSAAGNYCEFHTPDRVHLVRIPISRAADRLKDHGFVQAHRSALINIGALVVVERLERTGGLVARLRNGEVVPVGRRYRDDLSCRLGGRSSQG